jgi:N-sulfoglucosamine sulfohydrolase
MTNLILIDCHDLGQHLGCYGWQSVPSPNLDALAAAGVRFTNSFCTAPQCSPSRAALYTGRYPHANGMFGLAHPPFNWRLHPDEVHLARHLQQAGYLTAQIGVQHVTGHDVASVRALGFDQVTPAETAAAIADQAVAFLRAQPRRPFFLNIGFPEPHRDAHGRYNQALPDASRGVEVPPYLPQSAAARLEFAELQGVIGALDTAVGRIWQAMQELNLVDETWLIFTVDHGLAMPRAKCTLYDPGLQTALIMLAPGLGLAGGRVCDELVSNVDLLPTVLEMLGVTIPERVQGRSFAGLLRRQHHAPRAYLFAEKTFHTAYEPQRAVRTTRFKLIWNAETGIMNVPGDIMHSPIYPEMIDQVVVERPPFELYDLEEDPLEFTNRCNDPRYAEVFADLRRRLWAWMQETGDPLLDGPLASPFYRRGLEQLGGLR